MNKVAVVYWSGTGNTQAMAQNIADGAKEKGAEVTLFSASDFNGSMMENYDAFAFGCPSMGSEELEETEFEPMFNSCRESLKDRKIALFGSYGWGDGEWMRNWKEDCESCGALFAHDFIICNESPDEKAAKQCREMGEALAG